MGYNNVIICEVSLVSHVAARGFFYIIIIIIIAKTCEYLFVKIQFIKLSLTYKLNVCNSNAIYSNAVCTDLINFGQSGKVCIGINFCRCHKLVNFRAIFVFENIFSYYHDVHLTFIIYKSSLLHNAYIYFNLSFNISNI